MAKLELEGISKFVECSSKEVDKQLSDNLYVILEFSHSNVESDEVTKEVIKEFGKKYTVNYCVAITSKINHYYVVLTKDNYVSMGAGFVIIDLLYKDVTDKVDKVTEEGKYECNINIYSTLNLDLANGIERRLKGYMGTYELNVHLEGKYMDIPRNLRVWWNRDWVITYKCAKIREYDERTNPTRDHVTTRDIMCMASGEFYELYGPIR